MKLVQQVRKVLLGLPGQLDHKGFKEISDPQDRQVLKVSKVLLDLPVLRETLDQLDPRVLPGKQDQQALLARREQLGQLVRRGGLVQQGLLAPQALHQQLPDPLVPLALLDHWMILQT